MRRNFCHKISLDRLEMLILLFFASTFSTHGADSQWLDAGLAGSLIWTDQMANYSMGSAICGSLGGNLPVIHSLEAQKAFEHYVNSLTIPSSVVYLGLSDEAVEGTYLWVDDGPMGFVNWAGTQPSSHAPFDCAIAHTAHSSTTMRWYSYDCKNKVNIVCQKNYTETTKETSWEDGGAAGEFLFPYIRTNHDDAAAYCKARNASLPIALSKAAWNDTAHFIANKYVGTGPWLGLSFSNDKYGYQWDDGTILGFSKFAPDSQLPYGVTSMTSSNDPQNVWWRTAQPTYLNNIMCQRKYTDVLEWPEWTVNGTYGDHLFTGLYMNYTDARTHCQDTHGGDLPVFHNLEQWDYLKKYLKTLSMNWPYGVHLGLTDIEKKGVFTWIDGEQMNLPGYVWAGSQPTQGAEDNCISVAKSPGYMRDGLCSLKHFVVCQRNYPGVQTFVPQWHPSGEAGELLFTGQLANYTAGVELCAGIGGTLPIFHSNVSHYRFQQFLKTEGAKGIWTYIGLTDLAQEGEYRWEDGSLMGWYKWWPSAPHGGDTIDCALIMYPGNHQHTDGFYDIGCSHTGFIVCQRNFAESYIAPTWESHGAAGSLLYTSHKYNFSAAMEICAGFGGHLPMLKTPEANSAFSSFARTKIYINHATTLGLSELTDNRDPTSEGILRWVDGEILTYHNVAFGHASALTSASIGALRFQRNQEHLTDYWYPTYYERSGGNLYFTSCQKDYTETVTSNSDHWVSAGRAGEVWFSVHRGTRDEGADLCANYGAHPIIVHSDYDWELITNVWDDGQVLGGIDQWAPNEPYHNHDCIQARYDSTETSGKWISSGNCNNWGFIVCHRNYAGATDDPPPSWDNSFPAAGELTFVVQKYNYSMASDYCATNGGHLPIVHSEAAQNALIEFGKQHVPWRANIWMGLKKTESTGLFQYEDGSYPSYLNWYPSHPTSHPCVYFNFPSNNIHQGGDDFTWRETLCDNKNNLFFICQKNYNGSYFTPGTVMNNQEEPQIPWVNAGKAGQLYVTKQKANLSTAEEYCQALGPDTHVAALHNSVVFNDSQLVYESISQHLVSYMLPLEQTEPKKYTWTLDGTEIVFHNFVGNVTPSNPSLCTYIYHLFTRIWYPGCANLYFLCQRNYACAAPSNKLKRCRIETVRNYRAPPRFGEIRTEVVERADDCGIGCCRRERWCSGVSTEVLNNGSFLCHYHVCNMYGYLDPAPGWTHGGVVLGLE